MDKLEVNYEDVPEDYQTLGGRGLTSTIVASEVPPDCHPLGPNNKIVLAPGIVTGTDAPSSGRISVGGKSPLTGGIKEANAGTSFSQMLGRLQIKAIVIQGQRKRVIPAHDYDALVRESVDEVKKVVKKEKLDAERVLRAERANKNRKSLVKWLENRIEGYYLLKITKDGAELLDASEWSEKGLYEAYDELHEEFGEKVGICGVGIAAEMLGANTGLCFNDLEGRSSRYAGRGGLGAVMASRGLKFIVVNDEGAPGVEIKDEEAFESGKKKLTDALQEHDVTKPGGALNSYGTDVLINIINEAHGLPQRNFSSGYDERSSKVSGEAKAEEIKKRGGTRPHPCHPGCIIQCSEIWVKPDGSDPVGVLEYESVWALGPNCGIYDLDTIGELNRACDDLGIDTIEAGNTIAVAMEGGLAEFGDGEKALELLEEIRKGTPTGRILVNGAEFTGKALGVARIPTVKGQALPAYEPRAIKGIGVTYATSPMGADHTSGYAIATEIMGVGGEADPLDTEKADLSRNLQYATAALDATGYCLFTAFAILDIPEGLEGIVETLNGVLGTDLTVDDVPTVGQQIIEIEREFNKAAGFTKEDDRLPEFMKMEELPPTNETFNVPDEELDKVHGPEEAPEEAPEEGLRPF
ncbi:aldehyde:ferredoxin oxidoreductase [candidate division MSBL1 archaeon SCGC-AAA261O19]|uniref:Aldehyde:ferredoxin oxidoreductase n=1 Tax=candidate division MSBL1 archaeon SCGC-AAA261O19 TaxID=1698277 RepID=A0A133VEU7_9EURY|nr:aldehyde:ferredoxin oxidoreductase [candidate division MSBL1 archaeon SCGC-AAA261O19]